MRSGVIETDRLKVEGRQPLHRRKMAKTSPIVNGADGNIGYAVEEENMVRQVNLAAAYHDHISCTKSADFCKTPDGKEGRVSLPCETDHIYANCSDTKSKAHNITVATAPSNMKELTAENKMLRDMVMVQLELLKQFQAGDVKKERQLVSAKQEVETLKVRLERKDRRMCLLGKKFPKSEDESTDNSEVGSAICDSNVPTQISTVSTECATTTTTTIASMQHPATRYMGRNSRNIPLRALKRRYIGPPKSLPTKKLVKSLSSAPSFSSTSETHELTKCENLKTPKLESTVKKILGPSKKKSQKKHRNRSKGITIKNDEFLTTDEAYFLPDNQNSSLPGSERLIDVLIDDDDFEKLLKNGEEALFEVPSWKLKPVTSFYQMEGTENINDSVFQRRHLKCEQDERRRKRWDMQRLREQKANQKLKFKQFKDGSKDFENRLQSKYESFYPNPYNIEYIEVADQLPVLAFGCPISFIQPSIFSFPWATGEDLSMEVSETATNTVKKGRLPSTGGKVT